MSCLSSSIITLLSAATYCYFLAVNFPVTMRLVTHLNLCVVGLGLDMKKTQ